MCAYQSLFVSCNKKTKQNSKLCVCARGDAIAHTQWEWQLNWIECFRVNVSNCVTHLLAHWLCDSVTPWLWVTRQMTRRERHNENMLTHNYTRLVPLTFAPIRLKSIRTITFLRLFIVFLLFHCCCWCCVFSFVWSIEMHQCLIVWLFDEMKIWKLFFFCSSFSVVSIMQPPHSGINDFYDWIIIRKTRKNEIFFFRVFGCRRVRIALKKRSNSFRLFIYVYVLCLFVWFDGSMCQWVDSVNWMNSGGEIACSLHRIGRWCVMWMALPIAIN